MQWGQEFKKFNYFLSSMMTVNYRGYISVKRVTFSLHHIYYITKFLEI